MTEIDLHTCAGGSRHNWDTKDVRVKGFGSMGTYTVEQCSVCENIRVNHGPELLGEVGKGE